MLMETPIAFISCIKAECFSYNDCHGYYTAAQQEFDRILEGAFIEKFRAFDVLCNKFM